MPPPEVFPELRPTPVARARIEAMSLRFEGTTKVFPSLASFPNSPMYCSARRSCIAWGDQGPGDALESFGSCVGHGQDRRSLTLGLIDLLLAIGLGFLDDLLLFALGLVDCRIALALGLQHHGPLLPLGAHLLLHRGENVRGRRDVLDLVAKHLHSPGIRGFVEF
jgi:hypothetical protein